VSPLRNRQSLSKSLSALVRGVGLGGRTAERLEGLDRHAETSAIVRSSGSLAQQKDA
jgi:hypothetical protein